MPNNWGVASFMVTRAKLIAYGLPRQPLEIRAAPHERAWMDATDQRYAYRCLPLAIANAHGWEILCPSGFSAYWDGGRSSQAVSITPDHEGHKPAISHFGYGVLTFHVPAVFRTEAGYDLMVQGPINRPKDAIAGLSGMVEADWTPFTFTMNSGSSRANPFVTYARRGAANLKGSIRKSAQSATTRRCRPNSRHGRQAAPRFSTG